MKILKKKISRIITNIFLFLFDKILVFRHKLKLNIFKSPISEFKAILFKLHHFKAIFLFKSFNWKKNPLFAKSKEFKIYGFTSFSNKEIQFHSANLLKKIKEYKNPWNSNNVFKYSISNNLKDDLINIFDNGVDDFIKSVYKSDYCLFSHSIYKSKRENDDQIPVGSELWHADGYPGTSLNLMICHTPINELNGSMKIIPWKQSKKLLSKLYFDYKQFIRYQSFLDPIDSKNREIYREFKCDMLKKYIENQSIKYFQARSDKSGTIFAFTNNCVHAGGYTNVNCERIVSLFQVYPSVKITCLKSKFENIKINTLKMPKLNNIFNT